MTDSSPALDRDTAVSLSHVGKRFASGLTALTDVNLTVRRGEFVSLLGPSGCGKSTLLRIVAGLSTPSAGTCAVSWRDGQQGRSAAGRIGFVFQEPTLMPWNSVMNNVLLPFRIARRLGAPERERAKAGLQAVGLGGFENAYPHQLSGGMRMRVSIARALVTQPDLLLLDEPFAALDEITRQQLNDDLLSLWSAQRFTVVFVTHSVFESVYLAQRIVVMRARPGRIVEELRLSPPAARNAGYRLTAAYASACSAASAALAEAVAA